MSIIQVYTKNEYLFIFYHDIFRICYR